MEACQLVLEHVADTEPRRSPVVLPEHRLVQREGAAHLHRLALCRLLPLRLREQLVQVRLVVRVLLHRLPVDFLVQLSDLRPVLLWVSQHVKERLIFNKEEHENYLEESSDSRPKVDYFPPLRLEIRLPVSV